MSRSAVIEDRQRDAIIMSVEMSSGAAQLHEKKHSKKARNS